MDDIVKRVVQINNRLQERRLEKQGKDVGWIPKPRTQRQSTRYPSNYYGPQPIELDIAQQQDRRTQQKKAKMPAKYSKKEQKCFNCRKARYFKRECRSLSQKYEKK